jgi:hypothetical protein
MPTIMPAPVVTKSGGEPEADAVGTVPLRRTLTGGTSAPWALSSRRIESTRVASAKPSRAPLSNNELLEVLHDRLFSQDRQILEWSFAKPLVETPVEGRAGVGVLPQQSELPGLARLEPLGSSPVPLTQPVAQRQDLQSDLRAHRSSLNLSLLGATAPASDLSARSPASGHSRCSVRAPLRAGSRCSRRPLSPSLWRPGGGEP